MQNSKWIKESEVREWLGVSTQYLYNLRIEGAINFSYIKGTRGLMYDKNSIEALLEKNSLETTMKKI